MDTPSLRRRYVNCCREPPKPALPPRKSENSPSLVERSASVNEDQARRSPQRKRRAWPFILNSEPTILTLKTTCSPCPSPVTKEAVCQAYRVSVGIFLLAARLAAKW